MSRKFLIITGANTAREICGEKPMYYDYGDRSEWVRDFNKWEKARFSLKEYRITNTEQVYNVTIGTKVECECNDQDLTCVIV